MTSRFHFPSSHWSSKKKDDAAMVSFTRVQSISDDPDPVTRTPPVQTKAFYRTTSSPAPVSPTATATLKTVKSTPTLSSAAREKPRKRRIRSEVVTSQFSIDFADMLNKARKEFESNLSSDVKNTAALDDFDRLKTIGVGSFGRVMLVMHKREEEKYYAMKILSRRQLVRLKEVEHALSEKRLLQSVSFPFIVDLEHHFKDNSNLYMVLEYVPGGEMFHLLKRRGKLSEDHACFYASQVVLALEYLHHLDIIYRDLKPENILIDARGYLKITDFGTAKRVKGRTWTMCGTPEYIAPEMILNRGYGKPVDWWALGVLTYEISAGCTPFSADRHIRTYERIVSGRFRMPGRFTAELRDLLRNLLHVDMTRRFGASQMKSHKWFEDTDWTALYQKRVPVPARLVPIIGDGGADTRHFQEYPESNDLINIAHAPIHADDFKGF
jgi:protein kinase A